MPEVIQLDGEDPDPDGEGASASAGAGANDQEMFVEAACEPGVLLVNVDSDTTADELNALFAKTPFVVTKDVSSQDLSLGFAKVELEAGTDVSQAAATLEGTGLVAGAQPNYAYRLLDEGATSLARSAESSALSPQSFSSSTSLIAADAPETTVNDPRAQDQWALEKVHAFDAWGFATTDRAVTVAVMDNGCEVEHEDLAANIVGTYNALDGSNDVAPGNLDSHGTHVAGIVAAEVNNGKGVAGVSYNAGLLPIKVFSEDGYAYTDVIAQAYDYVSDNAERLNIKVVNLSVGGVLPSLEDYDYVMLEAIERTYDEGVVTVCAAGNYSSSNSASKPPCTYFPVDYSDKMVGVINLKQDASAPDGSGVSVSSGSNYNMPGQTTKDISAPGTSILSTLKSGDYGNKSGTSMACPLVSGILALEFAANPDISVSDAIEALHAGATDLGETGWDEKTGYGMANAYGAVTRAAATTIGDLSSDATIAVEPDRVTFAPDSACTPQVTVTYGGTALAPRHYRLAYENNEAAGTARVTATGRNGYRGSVSTTFAIDPAPLSEASIAPIPNQEYTGLSVELVPDVSYRGVRLVAGRDFSVDFEDNVNAGIATVVLTGVGNYAGERRVTFEIEEESSLAPQYASQEPTASAPRQSIAKATVSAIARQAYTGRAVTPAPEVRLSGSTLRRGVDYKLAYHANIRPGTAQITIMGVGDYTGRTWATFDIVAPSVMYRASLSGAGWLSYVKDGVTAGVGSNRAKRYLKAFSAKLSTKPVNGSLRYRVRTQRGWLAWKADGVAANVSAASNSVSALQVKLTGEMSKRYDVLYRARVQNLGWTKWVKNGTSAGARGAGQRILSVQVKVMPKK